MNSTRKKKRSSNRRKKSRTPGYYFCHTWRINFWYFIGWPVEQFQDYCKKEFDMIQEIDDLVSARTIEFFHTKSVCYLIWVRDKNDLGSLCHEAVHAAMFGLHAKGWKPDPDNDEPLAYLTQAVFENARKSK